eukprot:781700-Pleurochrysis_carterae.AAC.4
MDFQIPTHGGDGHKNDVIYRFVNAKNKQERVKWCNGSTAHNEWKQARWHHLPVLLHLFLRRMQPPPPGIREDQILHRMTRITRDLRSLTFDGQSAFE